MSNDLSHEDLVRFATKWLARRRKGRCPCSVIFAETVTNASTETPDAIGWDCLGRSYLVECKVSRSDFLRDKKKDDKHPYRMGRFRYYLVPPGIVAPKDVPEGWGLLFVMNGRVREVVEAPMRDLKKRESQIESHFLAAMVRRHELKVRWIPSERRFLPYRHQARTSRFARPCTRQESHSCTTLKSGTRCS